MDKNRLPQVSIVGRPNVGKSTLFNRLAGVRRAIVDAVAGSTRDRNLMQANWAGKEFELVDTGGLYEPPGSSLEEQVVAQCEVAIEESALLCWVVDAISGMLPEDEAIARKLRPDSDRVLLVVNKVDHRGREADAMEFHKLGFPLIFEVSAEHGLGVNELLDAIAERALERAHLCLLVADATQGLTSEDRTIAAKIVDAGRGAILVFNKWDLVEGRERQAQELQDEALERLPHLSF